jgi:cytochrome c551/c552
MGVERIRCNEMVAVSRSHILFLDGSAGGGEIENGERFEVEVGCGWGCHQMQEATNHPSFRQGFWLAKKYSGELLIYIKIIEGMKLEESRAIASVTFWSGGKSC